MVFKLPSAQKRMFSAFVRSIFQFFAIFIVTKLKPFSEKVKQSVQNNLNQNLVIARFLEKCFEAILSAKTNVLTFGKMIFSVSCKSFNEDVERIFWESVAKHSELFKSRYGDMKLLRQLLCSYLDLKNECFERLKKTFSVFRKILSDEVETIFWEYEAERSKLFK